MHTFKDPAGNAWPITINLFAVEQVKAVHKVDLPGLFDAKLNGLVEFMGDEFKLAAVVYDLGQPDNREAGRTLDCLKRVWGGETADLAVKALMEELIDFFRDPERRKRLRKMLTKLEELGNAVLEEGAEALGRLDPKEARDWAKRSSGSAGSTAGSSESIRVVSPSAN